MISVRCTIALLSDKSRNVNLEIRKEDDSKFLWKVIESSRGSLSLPATKGTWFNAAFADILTLFRLSEGHSTGQTALLLVAYNVKHDFLNDVASGKSIVTEDADLYNGNVHEQKVSCKLWRE